MWNAYLLGVLCLLMTAFTVVLFVSCAVARLAAVLCIDDAERPVSFPAGNQSVMRLQGVDDNKHLRIYCDHLLCTVGSRSLICHLP